MSKSVLGVFMQCVFIIFSVDVCHAGLVQTLSPEEHQKISTDLLALCDRPLEEVSSIMDHNSVVHLMNDDKESPFKVEDSMFVFRNSDYTTGAVASGSPYESGTKYYVKILLNKGERILNKENKCCKQ